MKLPAISGCIALGLIIGLALPNAASGQSDPGGARAPGLPGNAASPEQGGGRGTQSSGASEMSSTLHGVWTGTGLQGGSSWTIRLTLGGAQPTIEYPSLSCGGRWEPVAAAKSDTYRFVERITYGLKNCVPDGYVTLTVSNASIRYEWSPTETGPIEARGTLNR